MISFLAWAIGPVCVLGAMYFLATVWEAIFPSKPPEDTQGPPQ
jgi:hypothetical protein